MSVLPLLGAPLLPARFGLPLPGGLPCPGGAIFSLRGEGSGRRGAAGTGLAPGAVSGIYPDSGKTPLDLRERPAVFPEARNSPRTEGLALAAGSPRAAWGAAVTSGRGDWDPSNRDRRALPPPRAWGCSNSEFAFAVEISSNFSAVRGRGG